MELDPRLALAYATKVKAGGREAFAAAFDAVATLKGGEGYLDFKMVALGSKDQDAAYAAAFARAKRDGFFDKLLAHLTEAGLIAISDIAQRAEGPAALGLVSEDATASAFHPQGWTQDMIGMIDVSKMMPGLLAATRRVCLVCIDGAQQGSGFLVGPQTVITNWHVMHGLIDPQAGTATPGSAGRITCDFDAVGASSHSVHHAVEDWLVEWSPMDLGGANRLEGVYPDMTHLKPTALDFCIIRLAGAPGRARLWYDLASPGQIRGGRSPFFVIQHPAQFSQRVGASVEVSFTPGNLDQIRHRAPTEPGSSGGLCLDSDFRVVGLHQGELRTNGMFVTNFAIAARAIAAAAPNSASVIEAHDVIWVLQRSHRAVVGRNATLSRIDNMRAAGAPKSFLIVTGERQSGKSFTVDLIEDRISFNDRILVRLDPETLPADARGLAVEILAQAGVEQGVREELPMPASTTDIAWIKNQLIPAFRQRMRQASSQGEGARLIWIILDRLDVVEISQTTARSFLDALYEVAPTMPEVRIVLIGLEGGLPAGDPTRVEVEYLADPESPDPKEIEDFLSCILSERKISPASGEIKRLSGIAMQVAKAQRDDSKLSSQLGRLATVLSDIYYKVSRTWS